MDDTKEDIITMFQVSSNCRLSAAISVVDLALLLFRLYTKLYDVLVKATTSSPL